MEPLCSRCVGGEEEEAVVGEGCLSAWYASGANRVPSLSSVPKELSLSSSV